MMQKTLILQQMNRAGGCQGVNEMRLSGDTLLTGVLLLESGANRSADGVSIWSLTCEICLSRAFPSSRAYGQSDNQHCFHSTASAGVSMTQAHLHRCSRSIAGRRGTPRHRACFWNSTDPGTAGLCSPRHAPAVPETMAPRLLTRFTPDIFRLAVKKGGNILTPQEKMSCI